MAKLTCYCFTKLVWLRVKLSTFWPIFEVAWLNLLVYGSRNFDNEDGTSRAKRSCNVKTAKAMLMPNARHVFLEWRGCDNSTKIRYNNRIDPLLYRQVYYPHVTNIYFFDTIWCRDELSEMLTIRLMDEGTNEESFQSVAWARSFSTKEKIYPELCREFYATFEFNEICVQEDLRTKPIIHFRLFGKDQELTLVQFARRLGLYDAEELDEPRLNNYFDNGLRSNEEFNATECWDELVLL